MIPHLNSHNGMPGVVWSIKNVVGFWLIITDIKSHEVLCVRIFPQYSNIGEWRMKNQEQAVFRQV